MERRGWVRIEAFRKQNLTVLLKGSRWYYTLAYLEVGILLYSFVYPAHISDESMVGDPPLTQLAPIHLGIIGVLIFYNTEIFYNSIRFISQT